jgi:hypothetical protein
MAYSVVPGLAENVFVNETDPGTPQGLEGLPRGPVVPKPSPSRSIPSPAFPDQSSPLVSQVSSDKSFGSRINEESSYRESSILRRLSGRFLINQQMSGGPLTDRLGMPRDKSTNPPSRGCAARPHLCQSSAECCWPQ